MTEGRENPGEFEPLVMEASEDAPSAAEEALCRFEAFYLRLVIGCGILLAGAIVLAYLWRVSAGCLVAVLTVLGYRRLLARALRRRLGLSVARVTEGLAVSVVDCPRESGEILIPERLLWLDVISVVPPAEGIRVDPRAAKVTSLRILSDRTWLDPAATEALEALRDSEEERDENEFVA